jgi:hypothetical protein
MNLQVGFLRSAFMGFFLVLGPCFSVTLYIFLLAIFKSGCTQFTPNIRMSERDLIKIRAKAIEEGIPYQTLISMLIHKYNEGKVSIVR